MSLNFRAFVENLIFEVHFAKIFIHEIMACEVSF